jgi:hypothetical protein
MMQSLEPPVRPRALRVGLFLARLLLLSVCWLILLIGIAWAFGALWFDFPVSALRRPLAAVFALCAIAALAFVRPRWRAQLGVAGRLSYIDYRARAADRDPAFSSRIREGIPGIP